MDTCRSVVNPVCSTSVVSRLDMTELNTINVLYHNAEIARQATQIKMMRKLEKQAMAQAAKEAKKQQGISDQLFVQPSLNIKLYFV